MLTALSCVAYRDAMFAWPKPVVLRFTELVRATTLEDPQWTVDFLCWLRSVTRYPALVGTAAFVSERLAHGHHGMSRQLVSSVLRRADDPGHLLAHWTTTYGKQVPKPVKRGIADTLPRLYANSSHDTDAHHLDLPAFINPLLRWHGGIPTPRPFRHRDVIALTHPRSLTIGTSSGATASVADLVANLKRFDRQGIHFEDAMTVAARLRTEPSGLLPLRFVSARRALRTTRWLPSLEDAAGRNVAALPEIPGRTLIVVDQAADEAIVFALTLAQRCADVDVVADNHLRFPVIPGESPLAGLARWRMADMWGDAPRRGSATVHMYDGHDRVVVVQDQIRDIESIEVPTPVPVYGWQVTHHTCSYCLQDAHSLGPNRLLSYGVSDAAYGVIPLVEGVRAGRWPWTTGAG